jgi:glycosyltransferase involved in cell wall biosynthesis
MFDPVYNPSMAVRVLAALRRQFPDATLVMGGGDKGSLAEVKRLADDLNLTGAVRFPGFLDLAGKNREGGAADIFINTNQGIDNMPVAVLEALAMGLPVVATSVGGIPDLLRDGDTGLLVPDGDETAMAAAIERLLTDGALAGRLSLNGRRLVEKTSWEAVRHQWEAVFATVHLH